MMKEMELWPAGPAFLQSPGVFPLGTDSVLLSDFCRAPKGGSICDLGCGTGFLLVRLLWENPALSGLGLDISAAAVANTEENLRRNGLADRGSVRQCDLRTLKTLHGQGGFSLAVSNPPYYPADSAGDSAERKEMTLPLPALCRAAAMLLRPGGRLCVVYKPRRLIVLLDAMEREQLEPKRLRMVQTRWDSAPSLVLAEAVKGANPGLEVEAPLILQNADGTPTAEYRKIYHLEDALT